MSQTNGDPADYAERAARAAEECKELERRRNRFLVWAVAVALLMNFLWMGAALWRDYTRTIFIKDLSEAIRSEGQTNAELTDRLRLREERGDKALNDAFNLLNQMRDAIAANAETSAENNERLRRLEAAIAALSNRPAPPAPRVTPPSVPPPITLPPPIPAATPQSPNSPPTNPPMKSCLLSVLTIDILCSG